MVVTPRIVAAVPRSTGFLINITLCIANLVLLVVMLSCFQWPQTIMTYPAAPYHVEMRNDVEVPAPPPPPPPPACTVPPSPPTQGDPQSKLPYPFCDVCGPADTMCQRYGSENLARSRGYEGTNARLHRVLQNAERGNPTKIAVLGGSVTHGHGVKVPDRWTTVFGRWWNETFPRSELTLQVGAVPATGSNYFSMCFSGHIDTDPDIVLTELAINDQRSDQSFVTFEWLMRGLLELPSQPAIVNLQTFGLIFTEISTGGDVHASVSQYYDIPYISLRNVLLPQILLNESLARHWFVINPDDNVDGRHIGVRGHNALAELLIAYTQRQLCAMHVGERQAPADDHALLLSQDMETIPRLRMMDHYDLDTVHPRLDPFCMSTRTALKPLKTTTNEGWEFWSYKKDLSKVYLRATEPGSTVSFHVTVNSLGRVRLTYLRSAVFGLGTVRCWIDDHVGKAVNIVGHWGLKTLNIASVDDIAYGVPPGEHTVTCKLLEHTEHPGGGTEFRIIGLDSA